MNGHASMLHVQYIQTIGSQLFFLGMNEFAVQPELKMEVEHIPDLGQAVATI